MKQRRLAADAPPNPTPHPTPPPLTCPIMTAGQRARGGEAAAAGGADCRVPPPAVPRQRGGGGAPPPSPGGGALPPLRCMIGVGGVWWVVGVGRMGSAAAWCWWRGSSDIDALFGQVGAACACTLPGSPAICLPLPLLAADPRQRPLWLTCLLPSSCRGVADGAHRHLQASGV